MIDELDKRLREAARLRPILPITENLKTRSWMGGKPRFPESIQWPELDPEKMTFDSGSIMFIAQIDCSELPEMLWGGVGPRSGWLLFFAGSNGNYWEARVIHTETLGPERVPSDVRDDPRGCFAHLKRELRVPERYIQKSAPKWPVEVLKHSYPEKDVIPDERWYYRPDYLPWANNSRFLPFDWESARLLLEVLRESLVHKVNTRSPEWNEIDQEMIDQAVEGRNEIISFIDRIIDKIDATSLKFTERVWLKIIRRLETEDVTHWLLSHDRQPLLEDVPNIALYRRSLTSSQIGGFDWRKTFDRARYELARHAYANDPASLPQNVRTYFEQWFRDDAAFGISSMGGLPRGNSWEFDESENPSNKALLLEVPTSSLFGWQWGDLCTATFITSHERIANNDFSCISFSITN